MCGGKNYIGQVTLETRGDAIDRRAGESQIDEFELANRSGDDEQAALGVGSAPARRIHMGGVGGKSLLTCVIQDQIEVRQAKAAADERGGQEHGSQSAGHVPMHGEQSRAARGRCLWQAAVAGFDTPCGRRATTPNPHQVH
jgi:hypothetical protein